MLAQRKVVGPPLDAGAHGSGRVHARGLRGGVLITYLRRWWRWRLVRPPYPDHPEYPAWRSWRQRYDMWLLDRPRWRERYRERS